MMVLAGLASLVSIRLMQPVAGLEAAALRNDLTELRALLANKRAHGFAKIALLYARQDVRSEAYACMCGMCDPDSEDGLLANIVREFDDEFHLHERLAQSFWAPTKLPPGWMERQEPAWGLQFRQLAVLGNVLQGVCEDPTPRSHRASVEGVAIAPSELHFAMRNPLLLAMSRYLAEMGLYEEARIRLAILPAWPTGSLLEVQRARVLVAVREHLGPEQIGNETRVREQAFLDAAFSDDAQGLLSIASDPSHYAALASRIPLVHLGRTVDGLPPLEFCSCTHCNAANASQTLTKHAEIAARLWICAPVGKEVRMDCEALHKHHTTLRHAQMTNDHAARELSLMAIALHDCGTEECRENAKNTAHLLVEYETEPLAGPCHLAAATCFERRGETTRARELFGKVPCFAPGSAIETHRQWLSARLALGSVADAGLRCEPQG
jgi:hypothetical protein